MELVGQADIADPAVTRFVEPRALEILRTLPLRERYLAALWVGDQPVAAAAARLLLPRAQAEILSLACLQPLNSTDALGAAVRHLAGVVTGARMSLSFDATGTLEGHIERALHVGGLRPMDTWEWIEMPAQGVAQARARVTAAPLDRIRLIPDLTAEQRLVLERKGSFTAHPEDLVECSPVLLDDEDTPVAMVVARRGRPGVLLHWAWVDPGHRRRGTILALGDHVFRLIGEQGLTGPVRFRVHADNDASYHVIDGVLSEAMRKLYRTQTWRVRPDE